MSEEAPKTKKKVVRAQSTTKITSAADAKKKRRETEITWQATPEQKAKARNLRIFAFIAWLLAIGLEFYVAYVEFQKPSVNTLLVVGLILVIGALAIAGSIMWKKSNKLDPASEKDRVKFFIQNQLGAFMAAIAFIPLIVLVFTNKNMDGKQKGIIGAVAILMFGGAFYSGVETNAASQELYSMDQDLVVKLMGKDEVYWTKGGKVYHLCESVSDLQRESETNTIEVGTISQAQDAGKNRLTKKVALEAKQCGLDPAVYEPLIAEWEAGTLSSTPAPETTDGSSDETSEAPTNDSDTSEETE